MDYTKNEVKGLKVEGFPTLKFWPAKEKIEIEYEGDRSEEDLIKFVTEHKKS